MDGGDEEELVQQFGEMKVKKIRKCAQCGENHKFKHCPQLLELKKNLSVENYFCTDYADIYLDDIHGFCASGVLLTRTLRGETYFLAVKEKRNKKYLFNIIGGKREGLSEGPIDTAFREFEEETGLSVRDQRVSKYIWMAYPKFFILHIHNDSFSIRDQVLEKNILSLDWVRLNSYRRDDFHHFANAMIDYYKLIT